MSTPSLPSPIFTQSPLVQTSAGNVATSSSSQSSPSQPQAQPSQAQVALTAAAAAVAQSQARLTELQQAYSFFERISQELLHVKRGAHNMLFALNSNQVDAQRPNSAALLGAELRSLSGKTLQSLEHLRKVPTYAQVSSRSKQAVVWNLLQERGVLEGKSIGLAPPSFSHQQQKRSMADEIDAHLRDQEAKFLVQHHGASPSNLPTHSRKILDSWVPGPSADHPTAFEKLADVSKILARINEVKACKEAVRDWHIVPPSSQGNSNSYMLQFDLRMKREPGSSHESLAGKDHAFVVVWYDGIATADLLTQQSPFSSLTAQSPRFSEQDLTLRILRVQVYTLYEKIAYEQSGYLPPVSQHALFAHVSDACRQALTYYQSHPQYCHFVLQAMLLYVSSFVGLYQDKCHYCDVAFSRDLGVPTFRTFKSFHVAHEHCLTNSIKAKMLNEPAYTS